MYVAEYGLSHPDRWPERGSFIAGCSIKIMERYLSGLHCLVLHSLQLH